MRAQRANKQITLLKTNGFLQMFNFRLRAGERRKQTTNATTSKNTTNKR